VIELTVPLFNKNSKNQSTSGSGMLFAARGIEAQFYDRLRVYMWTGIALALIGLLIWAVMKVREMFVDSDDSEGATEEMVSQFRQLKRDGELSDEEFRLISQRLSRSSPVLPVSEQDSHRTSASTGKTGKEVDESTDVEED